MSTQNRPYQDQALAAIRKLYATKTKRVLLHLATGGGKTHIFCQILKLAAEKGNRSLLVVRGIQLIDQACAKLEREQVPYGVRQGARNHGHDALVQVASIDTLYARKQSPEADLIVIDEAHQTAGKGYEWFLDQYKDAYILAVSATPHLRRGMKHVADAIVYPVAISQLISDGYLVAPKYYGPSSPDLSSVKTARNGDYDQKQLSVVMKKEALKGDVVTNWLSLGKGRPTVLFAVNVEHSKLLCAQLNAAGILAEHIDAKTPVALRDKKIKDLQEGKIEILSNVGVLTTGFDCPPVSCLIFARPTKSYNLYIQMCGRGTRPYEGKKDFIIIDHAGNIERHGFIEDEQAASLNGTPKKVGAGQPPAVRCKQCFAMYPPAALACPQCAAPNENATKKNTKVDTSAKLTEIVITPNDRYFMELKAIAVSRGYAKGWIFNILKIKLGEHVAKKFSAKIKASRQWPTDHKNTPRSRAPLSNDLARAWTVAFGSTTQAQQNAEIPSLDSVSQDHQT